MCVRMVVGAARCCGHSQRLFIVYRIPCGVDQACVGVQTWCGDVALTCCVLCGCVVVRHEKTRWPTNTRRCLTDVTSVETLDVTNHATVASRRAGAARILCSAVQCSIDAKAEGCLHGMHSTPILPTQTAATRLHPP